MNQQIDYAKEFDGLVDEYNQWLASLENPNIQNRKRREVFLEGLGSLLDFGGLGSHQNNIHPLYSRRDLISEQKDAVALASNLKRLGNLDELLSNPTTKDAIHENPFVQLYEYFRNVYVAHASK